MKDAVQRLNCDPRRTEEEWKRLQAMGGGSSKGAYNQMAFNYDGAAAAPAQTPEPPSPPTAPEPEDQPYSAPLTLNLPAGMTQVSIGAATGPGGLPESVLD